LTFDQSAYKPKAIPLSQEELPWGHGLIQSTCHVCLNLNNITGAGNKLTPTKTR